MQNNKYKSYAIDIVDIIESDKNINLLYLSFLDNIADLTVLRVKENNLFIKDKDYIITVGDDNIYTIIYNIDLNISYSEFRYILTKAYMQIINLDMFSVEEYLMRTSDIREALELYELGEIGVGDICDMFSVNIDMLETRLKDFNLQLIDNR